MAIEMLPLNQYGFSIMFVRLLTLLDLVEAMQNIEALMDDALCI
jgi:hypothetical protein